MGHAMWRSVAASGCHVGATACSDAMTCMTCHLAATPRCVVVCLLPVLSDTFPSPPLSLPVSNLFTPCSVSIPLCLCL